MKMTQHGQPPTAETRLAKLKEALEIPSLNHLWLTISLRANPTYDEIVGTCKRYDKAMEQQRLNVVGEAHLNTDTGKVVCSYPRCGKSDHTQANCWKKKKDQKKTAQLKRAGRKLDHRSTQQGTPRRSSRLTDKGSGGCFVCGSEEHRALHVLIDKIIKDGE